MSIVKHYKYEKENLKDPTVCKVCGIKQADGIYGLVGGICMPCHSKANIRSKEDNRGFDGTSLLGGTKAPEKK